jgi:hypothetical protein
MRQILGVAALATSITCSAGAPFLEGAGPASAPSFTFTPAQFMAMYNDHLPKDGSDDRILSIKQVGGQLRAVLGDTYFQRGVQELKKMDLANGKFTMGIRIVLATNKQGFVEQIAVSGLRSDPVNMMRTVGVIGSVYEILNPGYTDKSEQEFLVPLGLMRGDNDPAINQPASNFSKGAAFTCVTQHSGISMRFGCAIEPRS